MWKTVFQNNKRRNNYKAFYFNSSNGYSFYPVGIAIPYFLTVVAFDWEHDFNDWIWKSNSRPYNSFLLRMYVHIPHLCIFVACMFRCLCNGQVYVRMCMCAPKDSKREKKETSNSKQTEMEKPVRISNYELHRSESLCVTQQSTFIM